MKEDNTPKTFAGIPMCSLERGDFRYFGPYTVEGTPFALHYAERMNATKWIMRQDAGNALMWRKDEALTTQLHHRFGDRARFSQDHTLQHEIAGWLREVHAGEEKAKNTRVVELSSAEVWRSMNYGGELAEVRNFVGHMPWGTRVRVTVERIK